VKPNSQVIPVISLVLDRVIPQQSAAILDGPKGEYILSPSVLTRGAKLYLKCLQWLPAHGKVAFLSHTCDGSKNDECVPYTEARDEHNDGSSNH
jgi:hypothetical protein